MEQSLFKKYIDQFMPKITTLIEKINGKRGNQLTYLHKDTSILRKVYSPDNKWEADTVNTTYVAADFVALDSKLPVKERGSIGTANGKLPKIGMSKVLKESDITVLNVMEAQGGNAAEIRRRLAQDIVACSVGLDERTEYNFLFGFSNGYVAIKDEENPNALLRLNFNYLADHSFGVADVSEGLTLEDIKRVIDKADADGNSILHIWIAKSTYDKLRQTRGAKELVAGYLGNVVTPQSVLPTPNAKNFDAAFADDNNGITFKVINRSVVLEANGKKKGVKPWNANKLIFACNTMVGALVYGRLAEMTNPVKNVDYQTIDNYKLLAKYSETNPLIEVSTGQAFVAPIIEDVDQLYSLDVTEAEEVNDTEEAKDTEDTSVTIGEVTATKAVVAAALKEVGVDIATTASDADFIAAYNKLTKAKKEAVLAAIS